MRVRRMTVNELIEVLNGGNNHGCNQYGCKAGMGKGKPAGRSLAKAVPAGPAGLAAKLVKVKGAKIQTGVKEVEEETFDDSGRPSGVETVKQLRIHATYRPGAGLGYGKHYQPETIRIAVTGNDKDGYDAYDSDGGSHVGSGGDLKSVLSKVKTHLTQAVSKGRKSSATVGGDW